jgi:ubiquinone/menaquinone biosynthesis C-methylase UbiE
MGDSRIQRAIGGIYSWAADRLYEPVVIKGSFRVLGSGLHPLVVEQGRRAVEAAGGRPVLDVPVGTAYFTVEAARRHDGVVVGADYAWGMAERARRDAAHDGVPNLAVIQAGIHRLPFADGSFGAVLCTNGLQVIPGLAGAVRELARVLAPRAPLLVSVIVAPLGAALPAFAARRLPTLLRSGRSIAAEIAAAGLTVTSFRRSRFAYLIEAVK